MSALVRFDEEGRPWPNMPRVVTYDNANDKSNFRSVTFYFYGGRQTHKLVLRFDRKTVTLSCRLGRNGDWQELKIWTLNQ